MAWFLGNLFLKLDSLDKNYEQSRSQCAHIRREVCVNLLNQFFQVVWISSKIIEEVSESGACCIITSENENKGLGKNLVVC